MRILEVILAPMIGGAETLVAGLANHWRAAGHEVEVVALDPSPDMSQAENARAIFGRKVDVLSAQTSSRILRRFRRLSALQNWIRQGSYDIVHTHSHLPNVFGRMALVSLKNRPNLVTTLHSAHTESDYKSVSQRLIERALGPWTGAVVSVSQDSADAYLRLFPSFTDKMKVIPNGVNFPSMADRRTKSKPTEFLAVGRVSPQKDLVTLVTGFDHFVSQGHAEARLRIVGPIVHEGYGIHLKSRVAELTNGDAISFLGGRADVWDLLRSADVFLHSANRENHPIAVIEAAGMGLPVVASDLPSIRGIVPDRKLLFPVGDSEAMAEKLITVANRFPAGTSASIDAAMPLREKFGIGSCAAAYYSIFERLVGDDQ